VAHLRTADPRLGALIERVGPYRPRARPEGTHFDALARMIVYQQLSTKAAATIWSRVVASCASGAPTPAAIRALSDEQARAAGLSRQKLAYLRDLAERALAGTLPVATVESLADEEVVAALTQVKGVGRWTAQMFLMFRLGRLDVLAEGDLGIQKAIRHAYRLRATPTPKQVLRIGARWR
jgi:3-methyladenine DNA glycosylase/8-oxoguanine DNA glycosylase